MASALGNNYKDAAQIPAVPKCNHANILLAYVCSNHRGTSKLTQPIVRHSYLGASRTNENEDQRRHARSAVVEVSGWEPTRPGSIPGWDVPECCTGV